MTVFKKGDKVYFTYSRYWKDREGEIVNVVGDNKYKISYFDHDCGKLLNRTVVAEKIRFNKTKQTLIQEEKHNEISKICHNIWLEFDIEIPFLSRPYSLEEAEKLYRRLKREHQDT